MSTKTEQVTAPETPLTVAERSILYLLAQRIVEVTGEEGMVRHCLRLGNKQTLGAQAVLLCSLLEFLLLAKAGDVSLSTDDQKAHDGLSRVGVSPREFLASLFMDINVDCNHVFVKAGWESGIEATISELLARYGVEDGDDPVQVLPSQGEFARVLPLYCVALIVCAHDLANILAWSRDQVQIPTHITPLKVLIPCFFVARGVVEQFPGRPEPFCCPFHAMHHIAMTLDRVHAERPLLTELQHYSDRGLIIEASELGRASLGVKLSHVFHAGRCAVIRRHSDDIAIVRPIQVRELLQEVQGERITRSKIDSIIKKVDPREAAEQGPWVIMEDGVPMAIMQLPPVSWRPKGDFLNADI